MNIGDYVRTKDGYIAKIEEEFDESYLCDDTVEFIYEPLPFIPKDKLNEMIIKSSPNIIDLIEVGDYVNGWRVNRVEKEEDGTLLTIGTITLFVSRNETEPYLTQDYDEADKICKLKSIVTKEQFLQMEYKVGE